MAPIPRRYRDALSEVYDPCCREKGISVVDMGLLHTVAVVDGHARVELVLTSGWCPFAARVLTEVQERMEELPEISSAEVAVVWTEPWTTDRLSPEASRKLRFLPDPVAVPDRDAYLVTKGTRP